MPGKPPYFPFYVNDFCADSKVEAMTTEEVGCYILLLCKSWHEVPPGSLPDDNAILSRWVRLDMDSWLRCRPRVVACFALHSDGRLHQKRLRAEYDKLSEILAAKSSGGRKGAALKRANKDSLRTPCRSPSTRAFGSESDFGSSSETKAQSEPKGASDALAARADFSEFWASYPRHEREDLARRVWGSLFVDGELMLTILAALKSQRHSNSWREGYVPQAHKWLQERRWQDEIFQPAGKTGGAKFETVEDRSKRVVAENKTAREASRKAAETCAPLRQLAEGLKGVR